jgi:biotin carboxyl carrier protein
MSVGGREYKVMLGWGDEHRVKIVNNNNVIQVVVDGDKVFNVNEIKIEGSEMFIKINNNLYRIKYEEDSSNTMYINGELLVIKSLREESTNKPIKNLEQPLINHTRDAITSPMPGRVVKVLVQPGTQIKKGQPLLIIESMKMENIISSDRDGIVREVLVKPGSVVNRGSSLVKITS